MRKFRKSARALAVGAAATALVLSGCSATGADDGSPTTIHVWHGFTEADGQVVQQIADDFNASQKDYVVDIEVNPWNVITDKLLPALKSGNGPDLVVQGVDAARGYAKQGAFAPLQDFYDDPAHETETYEKHVVDYTVFDGKTYGVPMGYAPYAIWYNKKIFADAGITTFPKTWDELIALAEKLTVRGSGSTPEVYGLSLSDKQISMLPTILESGGGEIYSAKDGVVLDSPENVATLTWWKDAYAKGWGPTNISLADAVALFTGGKAAMTMIGPWVQAGAESAGIDAGVFPVPAGKEKTATLAAANYWWMTTQAAEDEKVKAGSEAFLAFFNSHDSQLKWALDANYPPNRTDITADEIAANPTIATLAPLVKDAYIPLADLPGGLNDVNSTIDTLSVKVTQGKSGDIAGLVREASGTLAGIVAEYE